MRAMRTLRVATALAALAASALAAGCGDEAPPSQVLVRIHADRALRDEARVLQVIVQDQDGTVVLDDTKRLDGDPPELRLPTFVPLVPKNGDASRRWFLEARLMSATGATLGVQRVRGGYVSGEVREVDVCFESACNCVACSCSGGDCASAASADCTTCRSEDGAGNGCVVADAVLLEPGARPICPCRMRGIEADAASCRDGDDNDCDGLVDCADEDCLRAITSESMCSDGADDDCDGAIDACDSDCAAAEVCGNGADDDCDMQVDACDSDCPTSEICDNGTDDDCDMQIDSCDGDCTRPENDDATCGNGVDDDCDGMTDCAESACAQLRCDARPGYRCCDGACVDTFAPDMDTTPAAARNHHCGRCNNFCGAAGRDRQCRGITDATGAVVGAACRCGFTAGVDDCRPGEDCRMPAAETTLLCNCTTDSECGPNLRCHRTGTDTHNYCGSL